MWADALMAFGALGLILLGMEWMSQGLKTAAGPRLLQFLEQWTKRPIQGLLFGGIATVAVQSSSAITVATIGFVNAGILSLRNAAYVVYGSNVGTSLTGWFVAIVGMQFKIEALALPMIGCGASLKLFTPRPRLQGFGDALIGFGALFLGLGFLKDSFNAVFIDYNLAGLVQFGVLGLLLGVLLGTVLSTLMQASMAVIALVITAVSNGVLPLHLAAAIVIGANIGTTSTALMATMAATSQAKRLAVLHVCFNLITAIAAVFLLNPLLWLIQWLQHFMFEQPLPAVSLALFHTVFNILGVLLMLPLTSFLVQWLEQRFVQTSQRQLLILDSSSLALPALALKTLAMESLRLGQQIAQQAIFLSQQQRLDQSQLTNINQLQSEISHYVLQLGKQVLSDREVLSLKLLVQNLLRLEMSFKLLNEISPQLEQNDHAFALELPLWTAITVAQWPSDAANIRRSYRELMKQRNSSKFDIYQLVLQDKLSRDSGGQRLLQLAELRRFNHQLTKAMLSLSRLQSSYEVTSPQVIVHPVGIN